MIQKYKKKPVVISALQFKVPEDKDEQEEPFNECVDFIGMKNISGEKPHYKQGHICIKTLEGSLNCTNGDYIIKGIQGKFYPCKPDIFEQTYDLVIEETEEVTE